MRINSCLYGTRDKIMNEAFMPSEKGQVALAACCCQRLLPCYEAFCVMEGWKGIKAAMEGLDLIWESLLKELEFDKNHLEKAIDACNATCPEAEDFLSLFSAISENTVSAVIYTLEAIIQPSQLKFENVRRRTLESVSDYISAVDRPNPTGHVDSKQRKLINRLPVKNMVSELKANEEAFESWIKSHPLYIAELKDQQADLELIASNMLPWKELVIRIRKRSRVLGIQPMKRGFFGRSNKSGKRRE